MVRVEGVAYTRGGPRCPSWGKKKKEGILLVSPITALRKRLRRQTVPKASLIVTQRPTRKEEEEDTAYLPQKGPNLLDVPTEQRSLLAEKNKGNTLSFNSEQRPRGPLGKKGKKRGSIRTTRTGEKCK